MKIGFSSLATPTWSLATIISRAAEFGFDGVELRGLEGELQLARVPALVRDPEAVRRQFAAAKIELACLGSSSSLTGRKPREMAKERTALVEIIELASALGCPFVRTFVGEARPGEYARVALARAVDALLTLAPIASGFDVTILVENTGDFVASEELWFLADAVEHPSVRVCWNQCNAMTVRERPTLSLPRLGRKIGMVHMCDAEFDEQGILMDYKPLGEGHVEAARQVEILRGLLFDGYFMFEWPKLWVPSLPEPDAALPAAATFLRACLDSRQSELTAYKGDKNAPRLAARGGVS